MALAEQISVVVSVRACRQQCCTGRRSRPSKKLRFSSLSPPHLHYQPALSTTATATAAPTRRSRWIVSAWWDLSYIVVTPLLIVPVVLILARRWLTPEEVSLGVIAYASLGHHLPGFMRAYGDRDLFLRYRWRFLLVPPLIFAIALLFSPPPSLKSALGIGWTHLHGLELILLIWGTWHGLMQTYGFMRIYDVRLGLDDRLSARLDHLLCLCVFVCGVVFSDARVFGIANGVWEVGLPIPSAELLWWTRLAVGGFSVLVLLGYALNFSILWWKGIPVSWVKLLLIASTGWFYWYTGRISTNVLIGIAMFEIYHAVQYYAIVWIYNRRLMERAGSHFGPLGFLFRDRWSMLGIYLASIAAYSSIRFFTVDTNAYVFRGGSAEAFQWLVAFFVTSSFLHFYFDGFIWKVSEQKTQQNLVDQPVANSISEHYVPALVHLGKLALLLTVAAGLLYAEHFRDFHYGEREEERIAGLTALTPELPECQSMLCHTALARRDGATAVEFARRALELRPRSHTMRADLALAHELNKEYDQSAQLLREAIEIAPHEWIYHTDLGIVLAKLGKLHEAEQTLRRAVEIRPDLAPPREQLAEFYLNHDREEDAAEQFAEIGERFPESLSGELLRVSLLCRQAKFQEAVQLASFLAIGSPDNWRVQLTLGSAYNASGDGELALITLKEAQRLRPRSVEVHYQLGLAQFQRGRPDLAIAPLERALQINSQHFRASFQLANTYYTLGDLDNANYHYRVSLLIDRNHPELCANFGGLLVQIGQKEQAEAVYRRGLEADVESAQLRYNLGLLLWQKGETEEARQQLVRARELGIEIPPAVAAAILGE